MDKTVFSMFDLQRMGDWRDGSRSFRKEFQRHKRKQGFRGSVIDLFHREYETKVAVDDISFEIGKGEMVGYLGPNGAGKSTSIKMMVGILALSAGC